MPTYEFTVCSAVVILFFPVLFCSDPDPSLAAHQRCLALRIRQFDEQIRLTEQFAAALHDVGDPKYGGQLPLSMMVRRNGSTAASPTMRIRTTTIRSDRNPEFKR